MARDVHKQTGDRVVFVTRKKHQPGGGIYYYEVCIRQLIFKFCMNGISQVVGDWAYYTILVDLPKYMNDVLHVSIRDNGVLTSLPWAMFMLVSVSAGFGSDRLIASGCLTVTNTRKLLVTICEYIQHSRMSI